MNTTITMDKNILSKIYTIRISNGEKEIVFQKPVTEDGDIMMFTRIIDYNYHEYYISCMPFCEFLIKMRALLNDMHVCTKISEDGEYTIINNVSSEYIIEKDDETTMQIDLISGSVHISIHNRGECPYIVEMSVDEAIFFIDQLIRLISKD